MPKRSKVEEFEDVMDFVEVAFAKGSRKVKPEFADAVAVLVPRVVVFHKGATPDGAAWDMMFKGMFVDLAKASRAEVNDVLGLEVEEDEDRAENIDEVMERLDLQTPS
jgi:hypothetical protein